jgi:citrate lyase subunit beta/citryl-CoA lyase
MQAQCGRNEDNVRSDCSISLSENGSNKNTVEIESKVSALYGRQLHEQIGQLLTGFGLKGITVHLKDAGALPFVIAARFETALKRLRPDVTTEYIPAWQKVGPIRGTEKSRPRRTRLYLPGNEPKYFVNAGLHRPDAIILDLEDSVAPAEKDAARLLTRNALRAVHFYTAERMVRINQLPLGLHDLNCILPHRVSVILLPKTESAEQVQNVAEVIQRTASLLKTSFPTYLMPIIESATGVLHAEEIANASPLVCALAIGLEDYTADMGIKKTEAGFESFWARSAVAHAAHAAGVQAIDSVYGDVQNMEGLLLSVKEAKALGFEGKGVIHPRQIPIVHKGFAPEQAEIDKAKAIYYAYQDALSRGQGVVSIGSKMIDPPVVKRAIRLIEQLAATEG